MTPTISLDEDAKKFIEKKGNILTIFRSDVRSCCFVYEDVGVKYNSPKNVNYQYIEQEGLSIYVQNNLYFKNNHLNVGLSGIGPFKNIYIEGLDRF
ncbi:hypothetical protein FH966_08140 [Lentibacillus cibarius]|uniref:Iron-sulfur cluster biosynthesis family protein n=1 Tax=Lentibacillus cibarius TaxID=2583219 RepID=A0A549YIG2_9BACI|nr:CC/Se motif family (seleno)protein [Lentibacillus cibarius]TRM11654.1 hypothetical protein FH966_08140 [Lentibacillus cibarius]